MDTAVQCAECDAVFSDLVNAYRGGAPEAGDLLVCSACGAWLVYDRERLRLLTAYEFESLDESDRRALEGVRTKGDT